MELRINKQFALGEKYKVYDDKDNFLYDIFYADIVGYYIYDKYGRHISTLRRTWHFFNLSKFIADIGKESYRINLKPKIIGRSIMYMPDKNWKIKWGTNMVLRNFEILEGNKRIAVVHRNCHKTKIKLIYNRKDYEILLINMIMGLMFAEKESGRDELE